MPKLIHYRIVSDLEIPGELQHSLFDLDASNASYNLNVVPGRPTSERRSSAQFIIMEFKYADETFFVESDEPHQQCIDPRAAAKMVARQRQDVIAGELSRLAADEYLEDVLKHMQIMEACLPWLSSHLSPADQTCSG